LREACRTRLLPQRLQVVALGRVDDLVREDAGQFGLVHPVDQSFGDEDEAARCSEGVEARIIQHGERPWQLRPAGLQCDPASELVQVALQRGVRVHRLAPEQHRGQLPAQLDLLGLVDRRVLSKQSHQVSGGGPARQCGAGGIQHRSQRIPGGIAGLR